MDARVGCFALIVFLISCYCYVALPHGAVTGLQSVIVVFPDHTHLLFDDYSASWVHRGNDHNVAHRIYHLQTPWKQQG